MLADKNFDGEIKSRTGIVVFKNDIFMLLFFFFLKMCVLKFLHFMGINNFFL